MLMQDAGRPQGQLRRHREAVQNTAVVCIAGLVDIGFPETLARYPTFTSVPARQQSGVDFDSHCARFRPLRSIGVLPYIRYQQRSSCSGRI